MPDVPSLHPTAEPHQGLSDFFAAHSNSKHTYPLQDGGLSGEACLGSSPPGFDATGLSGQSVPRPPDVMPSRIDVTLPPPNFAPYPVIADDIIFQGSIDFDVHEQNHVPNFESVGPAHKKVVRQNSEPVAQGKTAAEEGAAMYVEALRRLNSFGPSGPSYEPFGSTLQPQDDAVETGSTFSDDTPPVKHVRRKEPPKPSYSDVAKATKGKSSQSKADAPKSERGESDGFLKTSTDPVPPKPYRNQASKRQYSHSRTTSQRTACSHSDGSQGSFVQPNSRYGLDQFEDVSDIVRAEQRSSSMESLNSQVHPGVMRRSSNSSLSSSTSAVEESHLGRFPGTSGGAGVDGRGSRNRSSSSHLNGKEATQDYITFNYNSSISSSSVTGQQTHKASASPTAPTAQKVKNEKPFFDPKRIFQSRPSFKAPASAADKPKAWEERKRCDGNGATKEETVLNNGKPNNTTSKAAAAAHRKADYINNDLREASNAGTGGSSSSGSSGGGGGGKRTNQTAAFNRHSHGSRKHSSKESVSQNGSGADRSKGGDSRGRRQDNENDDDNSFIRNIDWVLVGE